MQPRGPRKYSQWFLLSCTTADAPNPGNPTPAFQNLHAMLLCPCSICTGSRFSRLLVPSASSRSDLGKRGSSFQLHRFRRLRSRGELQEPSLSAHGLVIGRMSRSCRCPLCELLIRTVPLAMPCLRPGGLHSLVPVRCLACGQLAACGVVFSTVSEALKRRRCSICVLGGSISLQARGSGPWSFQRNWLFDDALESFRVVKWVGNFGILTKALGSCRLIRLSCVGRNEIKPPAKKKFLAGIAHPGFSVWASPKEDVMCLLSWLTPQEEQQET